MSSPASSLLGLGVGVAAAAAGIATDRLIRRRQTAVRLGTDADFTDEPDEEDVVISDAVPLHVEIDHPRGRTIADEPISVILSHGYTQNHGFWHYQRRALADAGYRVVLWDQRGHGLSEEGDDSSYTIDQLGRDLGAVLDQTCPSGPVVLIGHSMGGMAMMALADQRPELFGDKVIGAGFVSTSSGELQDLDFGLGKQAGAAVHRLGPGAMRRLGTRQGLVDTALKAGKDIEHYLVHHYSFGTDVPMAVVQHVATMVFQTRMHVISAFMPHLLAHNKHEALANFDGIETLVLHGTADRVTPKSHGDVMIAAMPHAEYIVVEQGGHMLPLEFPDIVSSELVALVRRAGRAAEEPPKRRTRQAIKRVTDVSSRRRAAAARSAPTRRASR